MNKICILLLTVVLFSPLASAQNAPDTGDGNTHYGWADVLRVDPVYRNVQVETPQQDCYNAPVVREERHSSTAGTLLGAVVGGVLGNTVGKGDGRKAATVAGAVVGGAVGNRAGGQTRTYEGTETRCRNVRSVSNQRRVVGYDVEYRYRGEVYVHRMDYDPGDRLRVRVSVSPVD